MKSEGLDSGIASKVEKLSLNLFVILLFIINNCKITEKILGETESSESMNPVQKNKAN